MNAALPSGMAVLGLAASLGLGLVFVTAALAKLRHRDLLPGVVGNYRLLPEALVAPVAAVLPFAEMAIGGGLLAGGQPVAVMAAVVLLWVFAAAMALNIVRGRSHIDCGCGRSQLRQPLSWLLVGRNVALSLLALPRLMPPSPMTSLELATAIAGGACIYLVVQLLNSIGALFSSPLAATRR